MHLKTAAIVCITERHKSTNCDRDVTLLLDNLIGICLASTKEEIIEPCGQTTTECDWANEDGSPLLIFLHTKEYAG